MTDRDSQQMSRQLDLPTCLLSKQTHCPGSRHVSDPRRPMCLLPLAAGWAAHNTHNSLDLPSLHWVHDAPQEMFTKQDKQEHVFFLKRK